MKVLVTVRVGLQRSVLVTVTAFGPAVMATGCGETVVSHQATVSFPQAPGGIAGGAVSVTVQVSPAATGTLWICAVPLRLPPFGRASAPPTGTGKFPDE